jgi:hypothetical protein
MRWIALVLLVGCRPASSASDDDAVRATGTGTGGSTSSSTADSSSSGPDVIVPETCAFNPSFRCSAPLDCAEVVCGGPSTPFDANGCLRLSCFDDGDCPPGHQCLAPHEWGGDEWETGACTETPEGACECDASTWHLFPPQRFCVPADELPGGSSTTAASS